jgi:CheY-like chemotaxis protein
LVDDEPELVYTMAERLELRDFDVDAVTSGEAALEQVRKEAYDVVVVDVKMPGMSGHAVMAAIREEHPGLPVILLTGHGAAEEGEEQVRLDEACAYLYKPIDIEELIRTMDSCTRVTE